MAKSITKERTKKAILDAAADGYKPSHCALVHEICSDPYSGHPEAFCQAVGISSHMFFTWTYRYPEFRDAYDIACTAAKAAWLQDYADNRGDETFDKEMWAEVGRARFGRGRGNRVELALDPTSTPMEHYQQVIAQASRGAFTSSEFKHIVEAINIGIKAYEVIQLQKDIEQMKEDLVKMKEHSQHVTIDSQAVDSFEEGGTYSLSNQICEPSDSSA